MTRRDADEDQERANDRRRTLDLHGLALLFDAPDGVEQRARAHEVDALGARRSDLRQSAGRHLINQFLAELDGVQSKNDGLLVLAATNAPWHIDPAFRRPGRFDRVLFVPPPDRAARETILRILLKGKPAEEIDYHAVAAKTDDYSGADLKAIVDLAVEAKLQEALKARGITNVNQQWVATHRNRTCSCHD